MSGGKSPFEPKGGGGQKSSGFEKGTAAQKEALFRGASGRGEKEENGLRGMESVSDYSGGRRGI